MKKSTDDVNNSLLGNTFWLARRLAKRSEIQRRDNPRLDDFGREVLDPKPLAVPAFLEPLGQRIERLTRLGQARIDALQFDYEDESDDLPEYLGEDIITAHEVAGGDFDDFVRKAPKKPVQKKSNPGATSPAGDAPVAPTEQAGASPAPADAGNKSKHSTAP